MGHESPTYDALVLRERAVGGRPNLLASVFSVDLLEARGGTAANDDVGIGEGAGERRPRPFVFPRLRHGIDDRELGVGNRVGRRSGPDLIQASEQVVSGFGSRTRFREPAADGVSDRGTDHRIRGAEEPRQELRERSVQVREDRNRDRLDPGLGIAEHRRGRRDRSRLLVPGE